MKVPLICRRVGRVPALVVILLAWTGCGDVFRPVAVPVQPPPPDPSSLHFDIVLSRNGPSNPGTSLRIDVSGDTDVGVATVGLEPVHVTILPNGTRLYMANGSEDTVSTYNPSTITPVTTITLPPGSAPAFVNTTENGFVYVANSGGGTVAAISTTTNVVSTILTVGTNPVALSELPNATKLYVVNQGDSNVRIINTIDKTLNPNPVADPGGTIASPVWAAARSDNARVYVLSAGSGNVSAIDTSSDTVVASAAVGAGANYMVYDKTRNRLYITNPVAETATVLDVSTDTLTPVTLPITGTPVSIAALPDGTRAYVASYQVSSPSCPVDQPCSITSQVTVINASSNSISSVIPLGTVSVDNLTNPLTGTVDDTGCNPDTSTHITRFRLSIAASGDSSKVHVAHCDAGSTFIVRTSDDTLVKDLQGNPLVIQSPASAFPPSQIGAQPPRQNPMFVFSAQ
ncbi:MAG: YncE family protein [Acidobacteriia bacterium]|nr:YncE family protein [Terriglobia bacterium]